MSLPTRIEVSPPQPPKTTYHTAGELRYAAVGSYLDEIYAVFVFQDRAEQYVNDWQNDFSLYAVVNIGSGAGGEALPVFVLKME